MIKYVGLILGHLNSLTVLYISLITYLKFGGNLTGEVVYFTVNCYNIIQRSLGTQFLHGLYFGAELIPCVKRIEILLAALEVDSKPENNARMLPKISFNNKLLGSGSKKVFQNINLEIERGLTLISDTSILHVKGSVSYASQKPWLFPSTIRQNIVFGEKFDETRYQRVLQVCALIYDLELLDSGDLTIVEDGGLNFSKGQQIRINLARAVYREREIYLLDDFITSLDVEVGVFIFRECIQKFLRNKLVIFVTNNTSYERYAHKIIVMKDGEIQSVTNNPEIIESHILEEEDNYSTQSISCCGNTEDENTENSLLITESIANKNIYREDNKLGEVDLDVYKRYIKSASLVILEERMLNLTSDSTINKSDHTELNINRNNILYVYSGVIMALLAGSLTIVSSALLFSRKVSINLHQKMLSSVLNARIQFFDKNFIGNILNRFSRDFIVIDEVLSVAFIQFLSIIVKIVSLLIVICTINITFLMPTVIIVAMLIALRKFYLITSRNLRRLEAAVRSPLVGHINATLEGLTTIRTAGVQNILTDEFHQHQNVYTSVSYTIQCCMFAFIFITEIFCIILVAVIIIRFLITADEKHLSGYVGLAISFAMQVTGIFQTGIRQWADIENHMTSVERVLQYTDF
ncbi:ABC membrane domain containing protein [Asbolus verrucosus]|uniref:ABC membrane domain containing protein n=1 Tax=Asbolus verrucosus TaxID=1661398 RepID=A0A482W427_ASBVE|nr:ABC membrane domain containing protein [Asbolus verrucosus]